MTETNPFSGPVGYARDDRVFGKGEGLVEAGHRLLEIQTQRLGFVTARSAVLRPGETAPASARNRRRRSYRGSEPHRAHRGSPRERCARPGPDLLCRYRYRTARRRAGRARPEQEDAAGRIRYMAPDH